MLKKILALLSDAAIYGASTALGQLIGLFLLRVYTDYLSPEMFGVLAMLAILSALFTPLANLGMTNAIFRRFNLEKDPLRRAEVLSTGLASVCCSSLVLLLIGLASADWLADFLVKAPDATNLVRLTLFAAAISSIGNVPFVALRAKRQVKTIAVINIVRLLASMAITLWLLIVQQQGLRALVLGGLAADCLFTLVQFAVSWRLFEQKPSRATWRKMVSYGLPFVPHHTQAVGLAVFGQYMVNQLEGLGEAGFFSVATKFAAPLSFVINSMQNAWVAYKFQIHAEDDDPAAFFRTVFTYYLLGVGFLWVGAVAWGPEALRLMTQPEYHSAVWLISAATLVPVAQGLYFMLGTGIEFHEDTRSFPLISLAGLVTVVGATFALIPRWGAAGAALATVLGWLVMAGVVFALARRRFQVGYDWPVVAWFLLISALCGSAAYAAQASSLPVRLATSLSVTLVYPIAAVVVLLASASERERMQIFLTRLRRLVGQRGLPNRT